MSKNFDLPKYAGYILKSNFILSLFCSISVCIFLCLSGAAVFKILDLDYSNISVFSSFVYIISSFTGGYIFGKKDKENGILKGFAAGCCFFVFCLSISFFYIPRFDTNTVFKFIFCILSGIIGGISGVNSKNRRKIKGRK